MIPARIDTVHDDTGGGIPLVLVHGLGLDRAMWAAQTLGRDYRILAYDILGHGESAKPADPHRLDMFTDRLAALTDGLGLDRFALVGFSLGGLIALAFALTWPGRVRALAGRLAGIDCPTLVVTGAEDSGSTPAMAHRMAGLIPGARVEIIERVRHMLPIKGAGTLNGLLEAFIAKATADPA